MTCSLLARATTASSRVCFRLQPFHSQSHGFVTLSGKRAGQIIPCLARCNCSNFYFSGISIHRVHSRYESTATAPAAAPLSSESLLQQDSVANPPAFASTAGNLALEPPSWESMKGVLSYQTLCAVVDKPYQFKTMTPVQAEVAKLLPELAKPYDPTSNEDPKYPRDLLVKAKTGTGKTFAFLIPAIEARVNAIHAWGKQAVRDAG